MPGNLEALLILCEHAYGVKKKSAENPYPTTVSANTCCHQAGVKGAEGGEANP
jgi:hypothetical protein